MTSDTGGGPDVAPAPPGEILPRNPWVQGLVERLYPWADTLGRLRPGRTCPFLCVITPIFDPALGSLRLLVADLQRQSFRDFVHVIVSNGPSPEVAGFATELATRDPRFIYEEHPFEETPDWDRLMLNLGRRRRRAIQEHPAARYAFLDADLKILDRDYFAKLHVAHSLSRKEVIVTNVRHYDVVLPIEPIRYGRIDMANFTFSSAVAARHPFPADRDSTEANDYRYWKAISSDSSVAFLDWVPAEKDGNASYERATDGFLRELHADDLIPVFGNSFDERDVQAVREVLESHMVGPGDTARQFEQRFADVVGFAHGAAATSGTNAFWLLARALGLDASTEVILPNIHYFGIANALELLGVPYRVCDVGESVPNASPESVVAALTERTKAVILLDYGGFPVDAPAVRGALAQAGRDDVRLILDAANSPLTKRSGRFVARDHDAVFYSFDMNKILVTGDGGMVLSDDKHLVSKVRSLAHLGLAEGKTTGFAQALELRARLSGAGLEGKHSTPKAATAARWWEVEVGEPGLNMAMNNLAAALGLSQLRRVEEFLAARKAARDAYLDRLGPLAGAGLITLPPQEPSVENDLFMFWIRCLDRATRDGLALHLLEAGVYTTVKYQPLDRAAETPNAHRFFETALCLPLHQNLEPIVADSIAGRVARYLGQSPRRRT